MLPTFIPPFEAPVLGIMFNALGFVVEALGFRLGQSWLVPEGERSNAWAKDLAPGDTVER